MTKAEALAILERNADPYLADPDAIYHAASAFAGNTTQHHVDEIAVLMRYRALKTFHRLLPVFRKNPDDPCAEVLFNAEAVFRKPLVLTV